VLERLQKGIFSRKVGVVMGPCAIVEEPMKIPDSSDEKDKENINGDQWLITIKLEVREITSITLEEMHPQTTRQKVMSTPRS
jgi:hypothetical protein